MIGTISYNIENWQVSLQTQDSLYMEIYLSGCQ